MRGNALLVCCFAAFLLTGAAPPATAQQEVYHPGETYDSLQAGQDAYWDAEAQRRALIGRQITIENQIMLQNTWADPKDRYRPVHPESYGPVTPKSYPAPTLADVYAYPTDGGPVYYGGTPAGIPTPGGAPAPAAANHGNGYSAPVPVFQPWPRVPNDIWGTPYYGYVRQPIGQVKIWTGPLSYIYKPIYASPPLETPRPATARPAARTPAPRSRLEPPRATNAPSPGESLDSPPPPPRPAERPVVNPPKPSPPKVGQEI
jgi:hypothetical protein